MAKFNVAEARARFSELVQKAASGEEVVMARGRQAGVVIAPTRP